MPSTWSQVILHMVFSTKQREPLLTPQITARLYPFIGGIVRDAGGQLWAAGGAPDHVHLLLRWKPEPSIADLAREVKHRSSRWIHETWPDASAFAWQKGYGVFSVSASRADEVRRYIEQQEEHHRGRDFMTELVALLERHGVEYDPNYLE